MFVQSKYFPFLVICSYFILSIIGVLLAHNFFVNNVIGLKPVLLPMNNLGNFLNNFGSLWDSIYYLNIATAGYVQPKIEMVKNELFAFFPLFAIEVGYISKIVQIPIKYNILIASLFNLLAFTSIFSQFLKSYIKAFKLQANYNKIFVSFLALPFSFFVLLAQTESLFLAFLSAILLILLRCYNSEFRWYVYLLPVLTFGIALVRSPGVMVCLPILIVFLGLNLSDGYSKFLFNFKSKLKINFLLLSSILTSVLGLVSFLYYGFVQTGDFWISKNIQSHWGRVFEPNILQTINNQISLLLTSFRLTRFDNYFNLLAICLSVVSIVVFVKYFSKNYFNLALLVLSVAFAILPLSTATILSYDRLFLVCPIYFMLLPIYFCKLITNRLVYISISLVGIIFNLFLISITSLNVWIG
jgi:hypothetical protein